MSIQKKLLAFAAVSALSAATAVPAMALENEFHGMYRFFGFLSNAETGGATFNLDKNARSSFFAEQRARLMYIAKANENLKLVTHFEFDARFGGQDTASGAAKSNKYPIGDAGALDADRLSMETKNIYLDFNVPATPVNMKVGIQPMTDAYQGVFGAWDGAGVVTSAKLGAFTPTLAWFRLGDNNFKTAGTKAGSEIMPGKQTLDLIMVDGKYSVNKDVTVGASYYNVQNDKGALSTIAFPTVDYNLLHMIGVNGNAQVGPANLTAFAAYQFGDYTDARDLKAWAASAIAKVNAGPGKVNAAVLYLSGQDNTKTTGDYKGFRQLATDGSVSYYNPSNMWLLIRNGQTINSSTAIGGTDLTKGGQGLLGFFGGYEVASGKAFANANVGYAQVAKKGAASSSSIGTEVNATVGYKVYDNLTASLTGAYLFLGDGVDKATGTRLAIGKADASNPFLSCVQLNYAF